MSDSTDRNSEFIAEQIRNGAGRNELCRRYGLSHRAVTAIARQHGLTFTNNALEAANTARRIDNALWRARRETELLHQLDTQLANGHERSARRTEQKIRRLSK